MTTIQTVQGAAGIAVKSSLTATALAFFGDSMVKMIPYLIVAVPLILLDLDWGVKAAKHRYAKTGNRVDKPRFSRAFRGTFGKMIEYICWCVLACTAAIAFDKRWMEWGILLVVYGNEIISIIGNYLECKNIELSFADLWKAIIRIVGKKFETEIDPDEFIKEKKNKSKK